MSVNLISRFWLLLPVLTILVFSRASAFAADAKIEVQLIWGTDDSNSKLKPAEDAVAKKLKESFKWKNYFEVSRKTNSAPVNVERKEKMSEHCELIVKNLGEDKFEVQLFGKGNRVEKRTQPLPKGKLFVIGGNATPTTSWFVVLRRID